MVFWDEPRLYFSGVGERGQPVWGCRCARCQARFQDTYGYAMPTELTEDVMEFRHQSVLDFFSEMTDFVHGIGSRNCLCLMPSTDARFGDRNWDDFAALPAVNNLGTTLWYGQTSGCRDTSGLGPAPVGDLRATARTPPVLRPSPCPPVGRSRSSWPRGRLRRRHP